MLMEKCLWEHLALTRKPIMIYGMGDGAEKLLDICEKKNIKISGIFSSDEFCRYQSFRGFTVKKLSDILEEYPDPIILLAFAAFKKDLLEKIKILSEKFELYAPSLPMFESPLFDSQYYNNNEEMINSARNMITDDISKKVFDDIINYRLSGKTEYLFHCAAEYDTFEGININEAPVYLDLGAYNGDTALEFAKAFPKYKEMHLFEPNRKIMPKLYENTSSLNCKIYEYAAWDKNEMLRFNGKTGRSAALSETGKETVEAKAPDTLIEYCDIIKFDVEGAELEAIEGCKKLIEKNHPILIVSAYHKTDDLFKIPEKILGISNYKVYLRHKNYIPDWDTLYYFI